MAKRITSHDQNGDDILNLFKKDQDGATSIDVNHRVRVGIIGTGWIAAAHIKSYLKSGRRYCRRCRFDSRKSGNIFQESGCRKCPLL